MLITFRRGAGGLVECAVAAGLTVTADEGWRVTPQADHGELAFCTFWPRGVFTPDAREPKRFQACLVQRRGRARTITHHHLESRDKQRIHLGVGDRLAWVREKWNPVVTIAAGARVEAGLCAYMWDAHFGVRVGRGGAACVLAKGARFHAAYVLHAVSRATAARWQRGATPASAGAALDTPVYTGGRHGFAETFRNARAPGAWPWQCAVVAGDAAAVSFKRAVRVGRSDCYSLAIVQRTVAQGQWRATTLGPAFGEPAWRSGGRLVLTGWLRTRGVVGIARLALRVHRRGRGSVFDVGGYELFASDGLAGTAADWRELRVVTPPLRPAPDRVQIVLELSGRGQVWFDDIELVRVER